MDWFRGRVSLGNFPDLAGAVNKISESVKNIEKNFDSALGFEEKPGSSLTEGDPVTTSVGHNGGESAVEPIEKPESVELPSSAEKKEDTETDRCTNLAIEQTRPAAENEESSHMLPDCAEGKNTAVPVGTNDIMVDPGESEHYSQPLTVQLPESNAENVGQSDSLNHLNQVTSAGGTSESRVSGSQARHR